MLRRISRREITVNQCTTTIHASCQLTDAQDTAHNCRYNFCQSWLQFSI